MKAARDGGFYVLQEAYDFILDGNTISIPEGFKWNGASIPRVFWPFVGSRFAKINMIPSAIHDYLIGENWNVKQRDLRFYSALLEGGRNRYVAWLMYKAVRLYSRVVYRG